METENNNYYESGNADLGIASQELQDVDQNTPEEQVTDTADEIAESAEANANVPDEPTVMFTAPVADPVPEKKRSGMGIKVFFSLIAIVAAIVLAVTAGFVYGKKFVYGRSPAADSVSRAQKIVKYSNINSDSNAVYEKAYQSVVGISVYNSNGLQAYASGIVYYEDGYIVTNDHIYLNVESPKFIVTLYDGTEYDAEFVAGDTRSDIAVLKINAKGLKPAEFASSSDLKPGADVLAIGYPGGKKGLPIISEGIVSATDVRITTTTQYNIKMIQSSVSISGGSSGGALVNMSAQIIGMTNARSNESDSVAFSIPSDTVVWIADELINNGCVTNRGKLGITYVAIDTVAAKIDGTVSGLQIKEISNDSELYGKNISQDDIITHINDIKITDSDVALNIIESHKPGEAISFTVYHKNGKSETIIASLIPDQGSSSYSSRITDGGVDVFKDEGDNFYSDH